MAADGNGNGHSHGDGECQCKTRLTKDDVVLWRQHGAGRQAGG
jgi:hypothetical protein